MIVHILLRRDPSTTDYHKYFNMAEALFGLTLCLKYAERSKDRAKLMTKYWSNQLRHSDGV